MVMLSLEKREPRTKRAIVECIERFRHIVSSGGKPTSQIADLTRRYHNVFSAQIFDYLLFAVTVYKKGSSNVNQNIVTIGAPIGC